MKKVLTLFICLFVIAAGCGKESKVDDKKIKELTKKTGQLVKEKKYEEALNTLDEIIKLEGESRGNLGYKYYVLMKMEKYEDALKVALRTDEVAKRKSPWNLISIIEAYLKLKNSDKALEYLKVAIEERNFINFNYLKGEIYLDIQKSETFLSLMEKIKENIGIGKKAKDFAVTLLDGADFKLSAAKGRVVFIDFWATWCPPCRKAIPLIKDIYAENKDRGLEIIGISLDEDEEKLKSYIKEKEMDWKINYSGKGWYDDTVKLYNVSSIPSTWLIDKSGKLRFFDVHEEELKKAIEELINETID